jgi:hypothetical protein
MSKYFLLNIAIDNYENGQFLPLNNAVLDAEKLEKVLIEKYGFELTQDSLFNEDATRKNIIEAINNLSTFLTKDDNIIIHFAGHGSIHSKTKKGFWIPQDAGNSVSDYIPNSTIVDYITGIDAKHIFLILDSCFSGTFLEQSRNNNELHYKKLNQSQSRWVLSSGRHEKVSDGKPGLGSPFSVVLNEFLEQNSSTSFSVAEVAIAVSKGTGGTTKQQPIFAHIEGVGHKDGQMVFNLTNAVNIDTSQVIDVELSQIVLPYESAIDIKELGFPQKSIFAYYKQNGTKVLKRYVKKTNFICSAFTYEEIAKFIPEHIEVDEDTFIARIDGYDKLGKPDEGTYDFANVSFQRTEILDTPYMAICKCRGRMVAFSKTEDGYYNNLISWGKNQAESAAIMIIELVKEKKITAGNNVYKK